MQPMATKLRNLTKILWDTDAALTGASLLMLAALAAALAGLAVDPRTITGMPAWLKPAKFAVSTAIFMLTLAWVFTYLPEWVRMRRFVGRGTAAILVLEVAIIYIQAWRGTTSHFNVGTTLDAILFSTMGTAIALQTLLSVVVAIALWRQPFADRALGWALRLGLVISIAGASTGGLMVSPTEAQLAELRETHRLTVSGGHTVGGLDGGPGLTGVGWSREHGDIRVAHFIGLHALQFLPFVVLLAGRRGLADAARVRLAFVVAMSYFSLFAILLWQALRAQSLVRPDASTLTALSIWAVVTIVASWATLSRHQSISSRAIVY